MKKKVVKKGKGPKTSMPVEYQSPGWVGWVVVLGGVA